ncbi:MAG: molybdopterin-guanine dinucleotide biosynthesis protein B [Peptococcales bacterium]|jgi:molybdopterin-guanine dinucleotide biosynthesis protein
MSIDLSKIGLIILAGGKSSRMGEDKAFLALGEHSLIERIINKGREAGIEEIIVVTNAVSKYACLDVKVVQDFYSGMGPLAGIHTGLFHSKFMNNFIIPCDMPFVTRDLIIKLLSAQKDCQVVVPMMDGRYQPLTAIYTKHCIPHIEGLLKADITKVIKLYDLVKTRYVELKEDLSFFNINTPEDYYKAKIYQEKLMLPPIISVVGTTGSGKTTFLEQLIAELKARKYKVGVIKNDVHGFEIDKPGKSTWRFREAGADNVMICGPDKMAFIEKHQKKKGLDYYLTFFKEMDLVLTEGFKRENKPKLELYRAENAKDYLLCTEEELVALITDDEPPRQTNKPVFGFGEIIKIADFLEEKYLKRKGDTPLF